MKKQCVLLAALAIACGAPAGSTLVVSYIGSKAKEVKVTGATLDISMQDANALLDEVVVTALGIKNERKALGYNVTDLKSDELMKNKNTNVVNSLAGKVSGVNVSRAVLPVQVQASSVVQTLQARVTTTHLCLLSTVSSMTTQPQCLVTQARTV